MSVCRRALLLLLVASPVTAQTLVVLNKTDATAQLFDAPTGTLLATLPTGNGPHEVAVAPDGSLAVVADYGGSAGPGRTLTVIDIPARRVVRTIALERVRPHGIVFLRDNRTVVVTAEQDSLIVTVDVVAGKVVSERATGDLMGHMVAISPDEQTAYVANIRPGTLSIVSRSGTTPPVTLKVGSQTEAINLAPDGKTVWLGSNNTGKVYLVDPSGPRVIDSIQTQGFPYRIAFTPDGRTALVSNPEADRIQVIDVATRTIRRSIPLAAGSRPFGMVLDPTATHLWVTLSGADQVVEVELASGTIRRTLSTGKVPDGVGMGPGSPRSPGGEQGDR